jgi:hypothetical protein
MTKCSACSYTRYPILSFPTCLVCLLSFPSQSPQRPIINLPVRSLYSTSSVIPPNGINNQRTMTPPHVRCPSLLSRQPQIDKSPRQPTPTLTFAWYFPIRSPGSNFATTAVVHQLYNNNNRRHSVVPCLTLPSKHHAHSGPFVDSPTVVYPSTSPLCNPGGECLN